MLTITVKHTSMIPLEFFGITPDRLMDLTALAVAHLDVLIGNRTIALGEVATVSGDASDGQLRFAGDTGRVKGLGAGMTAGIAVVAGDAGPHAGAKMTGGLLAIHSLAGDWLGAEMSGGRVEVHGDAGHNAGSAYRGSRHGMRGGTIFIQGDAGDELGLLMRRGRILVEGGTGQFAGASMIAGTIIALGGYGRGAGSGMKRGTLITSGRIEAIAPGFRYCCEFTPAYLDLIRVHDYPDLPRTPIVRCYRGDVLTGGRGELLVLESQLSAGRLRCQRFDPRPRQRQRRAGLQPDGSDQSGGPDTGREDTRGQTPGVPRTDRGTRQILPLAKDQQIRLRADGDTRPAACDGIRLTDGERGRGIAGNADAHPGGSVGVEAHGALRGLGRV